MPKAQESTKNQEAEARKQVEAIEAKIAEQKKELDAAQKKLQALEEAREAQELLPQITKALRMTLRDFTIIADIPECAHQLPEDLTFGDLLDGATLMHRNGQKRTWYEATEEYLTSIECYPDTVLREKICDATSNLAEWLDKHEIYPLTVIPAENGREA